MSGSRCRRGHQPHVQIYVDQSSVLMPAAAVVFVIGDPRPLLIAAPRLLALVALIISLVATTLFTGMVVELVADVQDGRRDASAGQLLRAASPVLGSSSWSGSWRASAS